MRVKICGITNEADAAAAVDAGADAIGLNFVAGPRKIDPARGRAILRHLPPLVTPVALVALEGGRIPAEIRNLLNEARVDHLQLYGTCTAEAPAQLVRDGFRPIPVLRVKEAGFAVPGPAWLRAAGSDAAAVVLDAFDPVRQGGTGEPFCWDWVSAARKAGDLDNWPPILLAGGLRPENVAEAVRVVGPYGVDVSSGVEVEGEPGRKDAARMREFVRRARTAVERA